MGWFRKKKAAEGTDPYAALLAFMAALDRRGFYWGGAWIIVSCFAVAVLTIAVTGLGLMALVTRESPAPDFIDAVGLWLFSGLNAALFLAMNALAYTRLRDVVKEFRPLVATAPGRDEAAAGEAMTRLVAALQRCYTGNSFLLFFSAVMGLYAAAGTFTQAAVSHHPAAWLNLATPLWFIRASIIDFPRRRVYVAFYVKHFMGK